MVETVTITLEHYEKLRKEAAAFRGIAEDIVKDVKPRYSFEPKIAYVYLNQERLLPLILADIEARGFNAEAICCSDYNPLILESSGIHVKVKVPESEESEEGEDAPATE